MNRKPAVLGATLPITAASTRSSVDLRQKPLLLLVSRTPEFLLECISSSSGPYWSHQPSNLESKSFRQVGAWRKDFATPTSEATDVKSRGTCVIRREPAGHCAGHSSSMRTPRKT